MVTSSEEVHDKLVVVQRKVTELPTTIPVTVDVAEVGVVIVAVPDTTVHVPVPIAGALPARVIFVTLQRLVSAPAFAVVGG